MPRKKKTTIEEQKDVEYNSQLPEVSTDTPMPPVKEPKKQVIKNISRSHHKIYGVYVAPGGIYEVTKEDLENERDTMRIENAVKSGKLEYK